MGLRAWWNRRFGKKESYDSLDETLKAYKVRADMIEAHQSITAWMDHKEEYGGRMAEEPVPSWEHSERIIARLDFVVSLFLPKYREEQHARCRKLLDYDHGSDTTQS